MAVQPGYAMPTPTGFDYARNHIGSYFISPEFDQGYDEGFDDGYTNAAVELPRAPKEIPIQGITITFIAKGSSGEPLVGLSPTWSVYKNAVTNASQAAPTVTPLGNGNYKFVLSGANPVGLLDLSAIAVPRYLLYAAFSTVSAFAAFNSIGQPLAGLTPVWHSLKKASDGTNYTPQPLLEELSNGLYKTSLLSERVSGVIDLGATAVPRYIPYSNERQTLLIPIGEG